MPHRWLPKDFASRPEGGWVEVSAELWNGDRGHHLYHECLDTMEYAARAGFDGVCLNEHHSSVYGQMPSPNLMAAALARRTSHETGIIILGDSLPLYDPPIRVAEEIAMLDVLTGGRIVAGMSLGTPMDAAYAYGRCPATLRERYREAHDLIVRAWTERRPFAFNSKFTQLRYVNVWPRPIQKPHPPIWVPGGGSIETWDWCIQHNRLYAMVGYAGFAGALHTFDRYWERIVELDAEPNPYRAAFLQVVCVCDSDREAESLFGKHVEYFFERSLHVKSTFTDAPGYLTEASRRVGAAASMTGRRTAEGRAPKWGELLEAGVIVAGSPLTVRERLEDLIKRTHAGHLLVLMQVGSMPKDLTMRSTQLFAEQVAPKLTELWDDRWKDEWWIKPLAQAAEPGQAVAV
jgi:alkanesulfonate monooxygenase SsuD/methylene tetrahydromethanopterin reductase-like flavin-dependent oxidoreductase (luciferase family)